MPAKLVRDRIPERFPGGTYRKLDEAEYAAALLDKLTEEVEEYRADRTAEELADVLEVLHALAAFHGLMPGTLETLRAKKAAERGGFEERVWMEYNPDQTNAR
ncbi:nucleoside triphosphate pyrophosphohydrolase [Deinococcus hopiensis]|uniref:Predicted house-cleaning noncanonical NTP pyrophosphatase, all-alpha NTP-PPase (MazG) superfamily n=1 Tax=Deinococcus hopiensis KR-140 TaxID=695939 RepID=A0A1W1VDM4_9DEIO|nr:nucleoside triphosphate pyrophosphohydrolase [Deinococcus hopiensis]SMB91537.1 Predicted house-cleaning noncanonical NTP pyrophosphatase, all-alpha NTP-PPase (MazG) superfamily [Deinococcus hopiensis KR-140]